MVYRFIPEKVLKSHLENCKKAQALICEKWYLPLSVLEKRVDLSVYTLSKIMRGGHPLGDESAKKIIGYLENYKGEI